MKTYFFPRFVYNDKNIMQKIIIITIIIFSFRLSFYFTEMVNLPLDDIQKSREKKKEMKIMFVVVPTLQQYLLY